MNSPSLFISTVTREFAGTRQRIANILTRLGYTPVFQHIFGTEPGDLRQMLRHKIDACEGLIQIVGEAYGAEPPSPDADFGRVSYTQFEFLYARQKNKKTWLIFAGADCVRDTPPAHLDLPPDPHHPDPLAYQAERRELQNRYRESFQTDGHLRYNPSNDTELDLAIERLKDDLAELRRKWEEWMAIDDAFKESTHLSLQRLEESHQNGLAELIAAQKITSLSIRARLLESAERKRDEDLADADKAPKSDDRERLREASEKAHAARVARIDDLANRFVELDAQADATPTFREMTRILADEGVDPALKYIDKQRESVLARIGARAAAVHEQNRSELQPLLKAAELKATKGKTADARAGYRQLLDIEPDWPEALEAFAWFAFNQSIQSQTHGTLSAAVADAQQALALAQKLDSQGKSELASQRLLSATLLQMADVLIQRGQPGDSDQALAHYNRSLQISESILKANPDSAQAQRDVSVSLERLGNFLSERGQPGDSDQALGYYNRLLTIRESILNANPDSAQAQRDVSVSLERLGHFLSQRGRPGDSDQALAHYNRSLQISESILKANPDSAQAQRDVSVSLERLGNFLSERGQPGDSDQALGYYNRLLTISESILKANPDSAQAQRDVSVSLNKLGDFLSQRCQPGDSDQALAHYNRSLQISESILKANPDSAQAQRDVSVSLNKLGDFLSQRGQPSDSDQALGYYNRDLQISESILKANPDSAAAARDVVVSQVKLAQFRWKNGDTEAATKHRKACFDLLDPRIKAGMTFDPPIMGLYEKLKKEFGDAK